MENFILNVEREHGSWGARKIRERLLRGFSGIPIPAKSTIHAVLDPVMAWWSLAVPHIVGHREPLYP